MNENGRIYAPVSIEDVKAVLGEQSNDVGTLCMSDKINPYSLIRPMPVLEPWVGVKDMKVQHLGSLPQGSDIVKWEYKQWGYQVPYVELPFDIDAILDLSWNRPSADATHFKNLDHFDGYLHDVSPAFYWNVGSVGNIGELVSEEEIVVILGFGVPQKDIVSASGMKNNGGVVNVLEVFGGSSFYYGVRIQHSTFTEYFYSEEAVTPDTIASGVIYTGMKAVAGRVYKFTPFLTNVQVPRLGAFPSNLKVYNLKFAPNYEATKTLTCAERTVSVGIICPEDPKEGYRNQYGEIIKIGIVLTNEFDYPFTLENLQLEMTEYGTSNIYPRKRVINIFDNLRVEGESSATFEWNGTIAWYARASSTYATLRTSGRLVSVYGGQNVMPFEIRMYNPTFYGN